MDEFLGFPRRERVKPCRTTSKIQKAFLVTLCASKEWLVRHRRWQRNRRSVGASYRAAQFHVTESQPHKKSLAITDGKEIEEALAHHKTTSKQHSAIADSKKLAKPIKIKIKKAPQWGAKHQKMMRGGSDYAVACLPILRPLRIARASVTTNETINAISIPIT